MRLQGPLRNRSKSLRHRLRRRRHAGLSSVVLANEEAFSQITTAQPESGAGGLLVSHLCHRLLARLDFDRYATGNLGELLVEQSDDSPEYPASFKSDGPRLPAVGVKRHWGRMIGIDGRECE